MCILKRESNKSCVCVIVALPTYAHTQYTSRHILFRHYNPYIRACAVSMATLGPLEQYVRILCSLFIHVGLFEYVYRSLLTVCRSVLTCWEFPHVLHHLWSLCVADELAYRKGVCARDLRCVCENVCERERTCDWPLSRHTEMHAHTLDIQANTECLQS